MSVSQTRIRVRYAETDQMGVVYYANFFIWFELGRVELLRQLGFQYKQMEIDDDCHIPVVEANCRYKSPARYDDELLLETSVLALRRSVIKFGYRLLRPENDTSTLLAEGETTHVTVNRTLRKVPLPKKYVAVLEQFLVWSSPLLCATLLPAGCMWFAMWLGLSGAAYVPDAGYYRLLALGQRAAVPAPFSARILGPAIAGWLGHSTGLGVDTGFLLLGILCLVAFFALIAGLLWSWRAPTAIFAAIFLMPFWVDIFHDYYLPDLLHAAILAAILLCFWFGYTAAGLVLLFPAYLARESTLLVGLCLIFACWRRVRLHHAVIGVLAIFCAGLVSRHYGQGGPASVHGLGVGPTYWANLSGVSSRMFSGFPCGAIRSRMQPHLEKGASWGTSYRRDSGSWVVPAIPVGTGAAAHRLVWHFWDWTLARVGTVAEDDFARPRDG